MVSKLASFGLSLVLAAVLSRLMTASDYGTYLQVLYVYSTLLLLFSLGLPSCYSYFLARVPLEQGRAVVRKLGGLLVALGAVFSLLLFAGADVLSQLLGNPELAPNLRWFAPIPLVLMPVIGVESILIVYDRVRLLALYVCAGRLLVLVCVVAAVRFFAAGATGAVIAFVAASCVTAAVGAALSYLPFRGIASCRCALSYRDFFRFALPIFNAGLYGFVIASSSRFFVSRYFGADEFAIFSNGFRELPLSTMVAASAGAVLFPEFSRMSADGVDRAGCVALWRSAVYKSASLIYPLSMFCGLFAPEIMEFLFGEKYRCASVLFRMAIAVGFMRVLPYSSLLFALGKARYFARAHLLTTCLLVALDVWCVRCFPSLAAIAAVSVGTTYFCLALLLGCLSRTLEVGMGRLMPFRSLGLLLGVSASACGAARIAATCLPCTSAPLLLAAAALVAVPLYFLLARFAGLDYAGILRHVLPYRA